MSDFEIGSRARLTGANWAENGMSDLVVTITENDDDGDPVFTHDGNRWSIFHDSPGDDWSATPEPAGPKPQPGDLVRNITQPDLDYRIVGQTGVELGGMGEWLTLEIGSSETGRLPANLFEVVQANG
jgi:hypothetical protein